MSYVITRREAEEAIARFVEGGTVARDGFAEAYVPEGADQKFYLGMLSGLNLALNWVKDGDLTADTQSAIHNLEEVQSLTAMRYLDTPPG